MSHGNIMYTGNPNFLTCLGIGILLTKWGCVVCFFSSFENWTHENMSTMYQI